MARVTSIYKALKYVVECQPPGQAFFEAIAAFNYDAAAIGYAKDCLQTQLKIFMGPPDYGSPKPFGWRYRVIERKNNESKCLYRSDVNA